MLDNRYSILIYSLNSPKANLQSQHEYRKRKQNDDDDNNLVANGTKHSRNGTGNEDEFQLSLCDDAAHRLSITKEGHNNTHTCHLGLKETRQLLFMSGSADVSVSKRRTGSIYPTESDIRKILSVLLLP